MKLTGSLKELKDEDEEEEEKWSQRQLEFMELLNKLQVWSSAMYIQWVRFPYNLNIFMKALSQLERIQLYRPLYCVQYTVYLAQKPDILHVFRCICFARDRPGFQFEIQIIFFNSVGMFQKMYQTLLMFILSSAQCDRLEDQRCSLPPKTRRVPT